MIRRGLVAGLLALGSTGAVQADPDIGICTSCSNAGFAWAAEQTAPTTGGTHPVYVINASNGEVRYFDVSVWWDCDGNNPQQAGNPGKSSDRDFGAGAAVQSNCIQREAIEGTGDATFIHHMQDAHDAVKEMLAPENLNVNSVDIAHSGDSAVDLVGPDNSPAGLARANLQNGLADHFDTFWGSIAFNLADTAIRVTNRFLGSSDYLSPWTTVTVHYTDGTSIEVRITSISTGPGPSNRPQMKVVEGTARLPDGQTIPFAEGHFNGFEYEGESNLIDALWNLANIYGIPVSGQGGGGRIACTIIDGEVVHCTVLIQ